MEYAGGGAACTQPTCGLGVVAQAVHQKKQKIHRYREGVPVRQRKQEKEEGQRKWEVWTFVEVLKVLKMDYHGVVGSGNYLVTFVAQSQFVLIRCLRTLILKAWRPLRVGASSSIDGGSELQILTYPWGMAERSLRLIALAGQGRAETNGSRRAGVLFLGCTPVSVGQKAKVEAWFSSRRGPLRALTVRRRVRLSMMVPAPTSERARF